MKRHRGLTVVEAIILLGIVVIVIALLFPSVSGPGLSSVGKAQAKNDVVQLATAITAFQTEYGQPPIIGRRLVDLDLIAILTGSNATINPRNIVFIETTPFKKGKGGLRDGVWLDPWGGPYHLAIAAPTDQFVKAGTNDIPVKKTVALWNDPREQPPAPWWDLSKRPKSRYVTSWE